MSNYEELKNYGFAPLADTANADIVLVKSGKARDFPYAKEHIVDNAYVFEESDAHMEVLRDGSIRFSIPGSRYLEGPYNMDSGEGKYLLEDAGVPLTSALQA